MKSDPRRVGEIKVEIYFPNGSKFDDRERKIIENTARNCPVAKSLHPELIQSWEFIW
jgi:uncharacterized OsmC-like protein